MSKEDSHSTHLKFDLILICLTSVVHCFCTRLFGFSRENVLNAIFYFSVLTTLIKFFLLFQYFNVLFYVIRSFFILFFNFHLIKNHNPFYHFLFMWFPFQDLLRSLLMVKISNFFYDIDYKAVIKAKLGKAPSGLLFQYKPLSSAFGVFFKYRKTFFTLFLTIRVILFLYDDNTLPYKSEESIKNKKFFIAANLFNNEEILDDWKSEMLKLIHYVGKENAYVSIFENGDSKDSTPNKLNEFKRELGKLNISHKIITDQLYKKRRYSRIKFLSLLRNKVVEPIYTDIDWEWDEFYVLFFNDIIYKWQDVVKLILTNDLNYDMACGLDFYSTFYDSWVSRDLNGNRLLSLFPYFRDNNSRDRVLNGEPIRVFSCWNGLAVIKGNVFKRKDTVPFRKSVTFQSECFLFCKDMWMNGFNKILINPNIKVAYEYRYYYGMKYLDPIYKHYSYIYYYFVHVFEEIPNSSELNSRNITTKRDWKYYL